MIDPAFYLSIICVGKGHAETNDCDAGFICEANTNNCKALLASLGVGKPIKDGF